MQGQIPRTQAEVDKLMDKLRRRRIQAGDEVSANGPAHLFESGAQEDPGINRSSTVQD